MARLLLLLLLITLVACPRASVEVAAEPTPAPAPASVPEPQPPAPVPPPHQIRVVPRAVWAADVDRTPAAQHAVERITIHHTAVVAKKDTVGLDRARAHLRTHTETNGWGDLAYHFLVHVDGTVREGRPVEEAGDTNTNYDPAGHLLITLEGNFEEQEPTEAQLEAAAALVAWGSGQHRIPMDGVSGHRDHAQTACPGERLFALLPGIRARAKELLDAGGAALQWQDCVVAIDVGHSERSPGATSARGVPEYSFNRRLAEELLTGLRAADGIDRAFLIDPDGRGIPLRDRGRAASAKEATLLLSIHHDSVQPHYLSTWTVDGVERPYSDAFAGHSLFVSNGGDQSSEELGRAIGRELIERDLEPTKHHAELISGESRAWAAEELGLYRYPELAILRGPVAAEVLIEAGVILHRDEEARLATAAGRAPLIAGITAGVQRYCAGASP